MTDEELLHALERDLLLISEEAGALTGRTSMIPDLLARHGPVEAASRLALSPGPTAALLGVVQRGRPDLTPEHLVWLDRYRPLFRADVVEAARHRLENPGLWRRR